ncbi:MAG: hypothetical protein HZC54_23895 [Verrucomicrobia bacterium]|nr:hypothetical protein [Verrucomicrobiota bacterium]
MKREKSLLLVLSAFSLVWVQTSEQLLADTTCDAVVKDLRALVAGDKGPKIKPHFIPLPPGAARPAGWLNDWARDAAAGITGHLDDRADVPCNRA